MTAYQSHRTVILFLWNARSSTAPGQSGYAVSQGNRGDCEGTKVIKIYARQSQIAKKHFSEIFTLQAIAGKRRQS